MDTLWLDVFMYLIFYSFVGWCCECIYCSVREKRVVNRGFLNGPFCPIYGFGALLVIYLLNGLPQSIVVIFVGGMVVTSALEYGTSLLMEWAFSTTWWDYSDKPFNLHGRICLLNSTLFGLMCVVVMFDVHPVVRSWIAPLHMYFKAGFLSAFALYFIADFVVTLYSVLGINARMKQLTMLGRQLAEKYDMPEGLPDFGDLIEYLHDLDVKDELMDAVEFLQEKSNILERRLVEAFPRMESRRYPKQLTVMRARLKALREKRKEMKNK